MHEQQNLNVLLVYVLPHFSLATLFAILLSKFDHFLKPFKVEDCCFNTYFKCL